MTTPNQPSGATATVERPDELVNRLLGLPVEARLHLAHLLLDSVREGFTSLAEAARQDKELLRTRVEAFERGEIEAEDWRVALDRIETKFRAEFPQ